LPHSQNKVASRRRKKKILKSARGYYGGRSRLYRTAKEAVNRGLAYAYRDRRRINGLKKKGIGLDRKSLAQIAVSDHKTFAKLVEMAKEGKSNG